MGNTHSTRGPCPRGEKTDDDWKIPLQEWSEEIVDGVTYSILLERYKPEPEGSVDGGDKVNPDAAPTPGCGYVRYKTRKLRRIKAASLKNLVKLMVTMDSASNESYVLCFLATHRAFTSTEAVLQLLLNSFAYDDIKATDRMEEQRAVRRILNIWIDNYPEDFRQKPDYTCLKKIIEYLENRPLEAMEDSKHAIGLLEQFKKEDIKHEQKISANHVDISSYQYKSKFLLYLPTEDVAEYLTLKDAELFQKLRASDCIGAVRGQGGSAQKVASTASDILEQFNMVTQVVMASILTDTHIKLKDRAKVIQKWINIAQKCLELHNISSLKAIMTALQSYSIYRLKNTWAAVKRSSMKTFNKLSDLFLYDDNYKTIRKILSERPDQGAVPYIGKYLTELSMLDKDQTDIYKNRNINFKKRQEEYELLSEIHTLQQNCSNYRHILRPRVQFLFSQMKKNSSSKSFKLSRIIEEPIDPYKPSRWERVKDQLF